jgi:hypothetical protein
MATGMRALVASKRLRARVVHYVDTVGAALLDSYRATRPLIASPELRSAWDTVSVLERFSVKGLAGHLVRAGEGVPAYLDAPEPAGPPVAAAAYYSTVLAAMDASAHSDVRARGEEVAGEGPEALLARRDAVEARLQGALGGERSDRLLTVFRGVVMRLDDYAITRLVEVLVHADDLASSIGLERPRFSAVALDLAIRHLVDVARLRHGDFPVLLALARRERDGADALRVFAPAL